MYTMNIYTCQLKSAGKDRHSSAGGRKGRKGYGFNNRRKLQLYGTTWNGIAPQAPRLLAF